MKVSTFPKASESTQQRRDHIVEAATTVIAKDGLPALSVRAVAKYAGCSRGLVEHYFRNKTALLIASNEWKNKAYLERADAAVSEMTGIKALEIRLRHLVPYNETIQNEWKVRMAFWHQGITIPSVKEGNNRSFYLVYHAILEDMRQAQATGEIAATVPLVVTSELLLMTVIGLCVCAMNDAKLRQKVQLDRRLAMILGFLKTADVASLEIADPEND